MVIMVALYFLFLSLVVIDAVLTMRFGSHEALLAEVRNIFEKKKGLWESVKGVISGASANILMGLVLGFFVAIDSFMVIVFNLLGMGTLPLVRIFFIVSLIALFFLFGLISIVRRETPGFFQWRGVFAIIWGGITILGVLLFICVLLETIH